MLTAMPLWAQTVSKFLDQNVSLLKEKLGTGPSTNLMAQNAYNKKARIESFSIQGIARLFKKEHQVFSDLKNLIKAFEDHMGEVNKWGGFKDLPNTTVSQKVLYQKNFELELKNLSSFLKNSKFLFTLQNYNKQIAALNISEDNTEKVVLAEIKDEIRDIMKTKYDFSHGEHGLHEFRRHLRWILYEISAFNPLFMVKKTSCKKSPYYELGFSSYYSSAKDNSKGIFTLNLCPYVELAGLAVHLGKVKEALELENKLDAPVSPELHSFMKKTYIDITKNILPNLFDD